MVLVDGPRDRWPGLGDDEDALDTFTITLNNLTRSRLQDCRLDTEEWHCRRTRLGGHCAREWCHDDATCLGLPEGVDDGALAATDVLVVPKPCLAVNWFTDGAKDT